MGSRGLEIYQYPYHNRITRELRMHSTCFRYSQQKDFDKVESYFLIVAKLIHHGNRSVVTAGFLPPGLTTPRFTRWIRVLGPPPSHFPSAAGRTAMLRQRLIDPLALLNDAPRLRVLSPRAYESME